MKTWKVILRPIILALFIFTPHLSFGQLLAWQFNTISGNQATCNATTNNSNLNTSTLSRVGIGVYSSISYSYCSNNWPTSNPTNTQYIQFRVQAKSGYQFSLSSIDARTIKSSTGPSNSMWIYSLNEGTTFSSLVSNTSTTTSSSGVQQPTFSLNTLLALQKVPSTKSIIFRLLASGGSSSGGFGIGNPTGGFALAVGGTVEKIILTPSVTSLSIAKTANSSSSAIITSNATWTATSDQTWLVVNSGATGNGILTCTAAENLTGAARTATVTLETAGLANQTINVTQTLDDAFITVSTATANVTKEVNSFAKIGVTSNTIWTVLSDQTWLTASNDANGSLVCTATANLTIDSRIAYVTLSAAGVTYKTVSVTQEAGDATLSISATEATVIKTANSSATVAVTSNSTWTATSNATWLEPTSGSIGDGILTCTVADNPKIQTRIAIVTIKAVGVADKTFTVTQEAGDATLSVSAATASVAKMANSSATVAVTSNSTWTATSNETWLTPNSGSIGDGTLTCAVTDNPTIYSRIATVTIIVAGAADKTFTVTQAAGDATLSVSAATARVTKTTNSTTTVEVTSNSTWTATSDQGWLTVTSGATGNGTLTLTTTSANLEVSTRFATVILKANGAADKTVIVTQDSEDRIFSVSTTTVDLNATSNNTALVSVTSNLTWTAISNESWLTISAGTTGNGVLTCSATNTLEATREAIVTISAAGVADKTVVFTQNWEVNSNKYQLSMTVISTASIDNNEIATTDLKLAAFIEDECRGIGDLKYVSSKNRYMANLNVSGNAGDVNKTVTLRCYNKANNTELTATNTSLVFMPSAINGSTTNPYLTNFVQSITATDFVNEPKVRLYPNPVNDVLHIDANPVDIQQLQLIDATGHQLLDIQKMKSTNLRTSHLANGIYLLRIKSNGSWSVHQFVKK